MIISQAGERVVLQADLCWELYDGDGERLHTGRKKDGGPVLDPASGLLYVLDENGDVATHQLQDGARLRRCPVTMGPAVARQLIWQRGERLICAGQRRAPASGVASEATCVLERQDMGDPVEVDDSGQVTSLGQGRCLIYREPTLLYLLHEDRVLAVGTDRVFCLDPDLEVEAVYGDSFHPLGASLDERGGLYMVVRTDRGHALWALTDRCELIWELPLPPPMHQIVQPPVVDLAHTTYLVTADRIMAVNSQGQLVWARAASGPVGGAVATADGRLLVTAGKEVCAYDATGGRQVLYTAQQQLRTPAVLTTEGRILAASAGAAYCLECER